MSLRLLAAGIGTAAVISALSAATPALAEPVAGPLVDPAWLSAAGDTPGLVILDIRSPGEAGPADLFERGHVPGAIHSDYVASGWRTTVDGVPGMLPPEAEIEALIGGLGIGHDNHVVIISEGQSASDFGAAARVYWTFKVAGHDAVSVLEGGHAGWVEAGLPIETGAVTPPDPVAFDAVLRPELIATAADVEAAIAAGDVPLIDARPVEQYSGEIAPPIVGIPGTIPGAANLPNNLLVPEGRDVIDEATLSAYLDEVGVSPTGGQIAFCNTGHWAAVGWFLLSEVGGYDQVSLYDGSMIDWTSDPTRPLEIGADRTPAQ